MSEVRDDLRLRFDGVDEAWPDLLARRPVGLILDRAPSPTQVAEASAADVREVLLWLHAARPEAHDWHAGEGSFRATVRAIDAARANGVAVAVASRVTRSNARVLIELPARLSASGVALWVLVWPRASDDPRFTATIARLGLGVPPALAALDRARKIGLDTRTLGMPRCVLGPYAPLALASAPRSHAQRCAPCAARAHCPGADAAYLERFGEGELRALERVVPSAAAPRLAALVDALRGD